MKLKSKYPEALKNSCPYCKAKPNEPCKVTQAHYVSTIGTHCCDDWGRPTIHEARVSWEVKELKDGK